MNDIIAFIDNHGIASTIFGIILTTLIQLFVEKRKIKCNEKQEIKKEKRQQFFDKAELHIEDVKNGHKANHIIHLFMTDFKTTINDNKDVIFHYSKDALNKDKYKHLRFYIKNIGNSNINQLDICVTSQKNTMLCAIDCVDTIIKNKSVYYSYCYDRKILKNDIILIDIAYLDDSKIGHTFSSELLLLFRDSYENIYAQPFFIQQRNLYEPHKISDKEYRMYTTIDTALECFENPWMW